MKKLISSFLLFVSASVFGATLVPIQLLNPSGSTSGQLIVSSGPSSAPAWGGVSLSALGNIAANTVVSNPTGSSATPTAFAMPSCSASGNSLNWTSGTGFTCATGYALLSGATFTGAITPSQTAGIVGTTTNNNANAGSVGELVTNSATGISLTTATPTNLTSISLTAGDWEVSGVAQFAPAASTVTTQYAVGSNSVSATFGSFDRTMLLASTFVNGATNNLVAPPTRFSLSSTTTIYLIGQATFTASTMTAGGFIRARRVR